MRDSNIERRPGILSAAREEVAGQHVHDTGHDMSGEDNDALDDRGMLAKQLLAAELLLRRLCSH